jgi:hypothetical protein
MTATTHFTKIASRLIALASLAGTPAEAALYSLTASGTISQNSSGDATIPIGMPWSLKLTYDTAAPDLDFEAAGSPDPTFGRYTNTSSPPAMQFFHYKAGAYEVTLDDPADFGSLSNVLITSTSIKGIDINITAPAFFPQLAGGQVSFHADFAAFSSPPIFTTDALPTNTALSPASFVDSNVTLLPPSGVVSSGNLTSLSLTAVPAGDYNNDGRINAADYIVWRQTRGQTGSGLAADGNGDNTVDQADFEVWRAHFGQTAGGGAGIAAPVAVPEPATTVLLLFGACIGIRRRRRTNSDHTRDSDLASVLCQIRTLLCVGRTLQPDLC